MVEPLSLSFSSASTTSLLSKSLSRIFYSISFLSSSTLFLIFSNSLVKSWRSTLSFSLPASLFSFYCLISAFFFTKMASCFSSFLFFFSISSSSDWAICSCSILEAVCACIMVFCWFCSARVFSRSFLWFSLSLICSFVSCSLASAAWISPLTLSFSSLTALSSASFSVRT